MKKTLTLLACALCSITMLAQSFSTYRNPVIAGFHPDPSALRVGDDYYLVNSSFAYFPGVPIFHSKDLIHWEQIGNVLTRKSQLPLAQASSWLGIYAPTIRYHNGTYYMITTNVGNGGNFLVTASNPKGPWSEPVWLEQQGIDPSLYFEGDKCYMVSNPDNTIMLCEIDPLTGKQLTPGRALWRGTGGRYPEGPHIYKIGDWYYLLISEGGTELAHKLTIARSRQIEGPYESNPNNPIMTNCNMKGQGMQIQGTGHGDLLQDQNGQWWMVFLAYRNFGGSYHHLGRETYLAPVTWKNEWPIVNDGNPIDTLMAANVLPQYSFQKKPTRTFFENGNTKDGFLQKLDPEWVCLQNPISDNYRLAKGQLQLYPHGSLTQNDQPTYLGRRQESSNMRVETCVEWHNSKSSKDARAEAEANTTGAGLSIYQIHDGHTDFYVNNHAIFVRTRLKSVDALVYTSPKLKNSGKVWLRICSDGEMYNFSYSVDGNNFIEVYQMNCSLLSTEVVGGFTGVTLGMFAQGQKADGYATFDFFDYEEK